MCRFCAARVPVHNLRRCSALQGIRVRRLRPLSGRVWGCSTACFRRACPRTTRSAVSPGRPVEDPSAGLPGAPPSRRPVSANCERCVSVRPPRRRRRSGAESAAQSFGLPRPCCVGWPNGVERHDAGVASRPLGATDERPVERDGAGVAVEQRSAERCARGVPDVADRATGQRFVGQDVDAIGDNLRGLR